MPGHTARPNPLTSRLPAWFCTAQYPEDGWGWLPPEHGSGRAKPHVAGFTHNVPPRACSLPTRLGPHHLSLPPGCSPCLTRPPGDPPKAQSAHFISLLEKFNGSQLLLGYKEKTIPLHNTKRFRERSELISQESLLRPHGPRSVPLSSGLCSAVLSLPVSSASSSPTLLSAQPAAPSPSPLPTGLHTPPLCFRLPSVYLQATFLVSPPSRPASSPRTEIKLSLQPRPLMTLSDSPAQRAFSPLHPQG